MYEIPLISTNFDCLIPMDGVSITMGFKLRFNPLAEYWVMSLYDSEGYMLVSDIPLIPCENLLEQYRYMNIGSAYLVTESAEVTPSYSSLFTDWHLRWGDTPNN